MIVNKFYSKLEKLGFKEHKATDEEIKYLEGLSKVDQCQEFCNESNFNIDILKTKIKISHLLILTLIILSTFLFTTGVYWWFLATFLSIGVILIFIKHFKNKIDVHQMMVNMFSDVRKDDLAKSFR